MEQKPLHRSPDRSGKHLMDSRLPRHNRNLYQAGQGTNLKEHWQIAEHWLLPSRYQEALQELATSQSTSAGETRLSPKLTPTRCSLVHFVPRLPQCEEKTYPPHMKIPSDHEQILPSSHHMYPPRLDAGIVNQPRAHRAYTALLRMIRKHRLSRHCTIRRVHIQLPTLSTLSGKKDSSTAHSLLVTCCRILQDICASHPPATAPTL